MSPETLAHAALSYHQEIRDHDETAPAASPIDVGHDLETTSRWAEAGTHLFLDTLSAMSDAEVEAPSAIAGWTGRHILAHLHSNAVALRRLVGWARTGVEARMYCTADQRRHEIESTALLPVTELRELVRRSAAMLAWDLDSLDERTWARLVVNAQGNAVPAREIPWLRAREMFVHTVGLGTGVTFAQLPDDVNAALVDDLVADAGSGLR